MEKYQIYGIYFDGKIIYVGMTSKSLQRRLTKHENSASNFRPGVKVNGAPKLNRHMSKNNNFGYEIKNIAWCESKNTALKAERMYIDRFDTIVNGCNSDLPSGTGREKGCSNPSGKDHYLYGKTVSRHIVEASVKARIGKKLSKEHIEKIRKANARPDRKDCNPVIREDGLEYYGVSEAARKNGVCRTAITQAIKNSGNCAGYKWKYKEKPCQSMLYSTEQPTQSR